MPSQQGRPLLPATWTRPAGFNLLRQMVVADYTSGNYIKRNLHTRQIHGVQAAVHGVSRCHLTVLSSLWGSRLLQ